MARIAGVLALWTVVAVPLSLLVGRALASAGATVADEAEAYLRRREPPTRRRRRGGAVVAFGVAATFGLASSAAAHLAGDGEPAVPAPEVVADAPADADLPPVASRRLAPPAPPAAGPVVTAPTVPAAPRVAPGEPAAGAVPLDVVRDVVDAVLRLEAPTP